VSVVGARSPVSLKRPIAAIGGGATTTQPAHRVRCRKQIVFGAMIDAASMSTRDVLRFDFFA
jgi:hypothetical protein